MTMADFRALLKRRMGLDAESIGIAAVERAVRQRAQAIAGGDEAAYWQLLAGSALEQQELIETVVVPETSFFRHAESIDALALLARQRAAHGGALRILSLPCSSGEEPYTIAMALLDAGVDPERYTVLGMDISERLLARAEQGIYGRNAFRGEALDYRARHFTETPQGYSVMPRVRAHVRFQPGNLLDPGLGLPADAYDFVFCRNLLIYFDNATQETAIGVLRRLCRRDGVIFVGPAEASLLTRLGMRQIDMARAFAFRNEQDAPVDAPPQRVLMESRTRRSMASAFASKSVSLRASTSTPASASAFARRSRPNDKQQAGAPASLDAIQALADAGRLDEARAAATAHVETHGASAEAYYLVGLLDDAANLPVAAEAAYRKTLYLDPGHRQALLHLASLLETRGEDAPARQLRARAARRENSHA
ncbi:MAG TPA: CheR family methyltransferase [Bordetella sp.]|nr:CheR family methyltransferase [Bordetella sp.]